MSRRTSLRVWLEDVLGVPPGRMSKGWKTSCLKTGLLQADTASRNYIEWKIGWGHHTDSQGAQPWKCSVSKVRCG